MAHHKDAIKRIRTSQAARARNRANRSRMRGQVKDLREIIAKGDLESATRELSETTSLLQKLARKGLVHPRNADRRISRLAQAINKLKAQAAE